MFDKISDGRTDLVFDYLEEGHSADSRDADGVSLIKWCSYYGDVSAIRYLLLRGESLRSLGENFDFNVTCYHGHWRLCQFLIERGADVNYPLPDSGETPLHSALSNPAHHNVVKVLIASGANPNRITKPGVETGDFMRDCRTKAETPLHRAAAFGSEKTIRLLLDSGADVAAKDMHGDSPLGWASWYQRPDSILRLLCYGKFSIRAGRLSMRESLQGEPHS